MPWEPMDGDSIECRHTSPDGTLWVEEWSTCDGRGYRSRTTRLVDATTNTQVIAIGAAGLASEPVFEGPGQVLLHLLYGGIPVTVRIDARNRAFSMGDSGRWQPLDDLLSSLAARLPPRTWAEPPRPLRDTLGLAFMSLIGLSMTAAALFVLLFLSKNDHDRWIALFGFLFFGAGTLWSVGDLLQIRRRRRQ